MPIGPKGAARNDSGTKTSGSAFGTGPADTITQESEFQTETSGRFDARGNQVQVITLTGFTGTDEFTLSYEYLGVPGTTIAFVRGTNATAAAIQAELRTVFAGTDLTVVAGTTDEGPFTVTFNDDEFYSRGFPKLTTVNGTGCTGVITKANDAVKRYLGETKYEGTTELVGPTLGTITVTDAVDEVQTFAFSAGTDGGTVEFAFRRGRTGNLAWNAEIAAVQTAIDNAVNQCAGLSDADAPTVEWVTPLSLEIQFVDWDTTDDAVLTYATTHDSDSLEFATVDAGATAAAREAIILAWIQSIDSFASTSITVTEVTENQEYDVVFLDGPRGMAATDFALAVTGTSGEDATPDANTAQDAEAGWKFTFENGALAGMPIRGGLRVQDDSLEDGGVAETGTLAVGTAGVLGSISAAYTEQATVGDSIIAVAVNDTTGKQYGSAEPDAASPIAIASLPVGAYTLVARTVADRALSAPSTKAFTVASA
jgi:hypothetical protein